MSWTSQLDKFLTFLKKKHVSKSIHAHSLSIVPINVVSMGANWPLPPMLPKTPMNKQMCYQCFLLINDSIDHSNVVCSLTQLTRMKVRTRVVLDSWVVSQIWLDSDSNESSQSRVGRENQGYESSQSRITLFVIWVRVESTGYCWVKVESLIFLKKNVEILHLSVTLQSPTAIRPHPPPPRSTTLSN